MALPFIFADNARSTLGASLSLGGTTITLASGGGALFPNPAPGQQFALTLNDLATQTIFETVWCIARAGDVLTVVRAQEGTTAKAWGIGDYCWNGPTAGQMNNMVQTPHMTDASIAPIFGATEVRGTFKATGAATFSSTGAFAGAVSTVDPGGNTGGLSVQSPNNTTAATIALRGNAGSSTTPNKWLRAVNGSFDIVNSAYSAAIFALSDLGDITSVRNISATGGGTFGGNVTASGSGAFTDTGVNGVFINGTGGQGANLRLHTANGDKYIRQLNNALQVINASYTTPLVTIDDVGGTTIAGNTNIGGSVGVSGNLQAAGVTSGASVQANSGNVTAFGGRLRASLGAYQSGDPNAATLLADYSLNPGGYMIFPNGFIIQFGYGVLNGDPNIPNFFPIAFPNGCLSVVCTEGAAAGSWFVSSPSTPTIHGVSGFVFNAWYHSGVVWSESAGKVWNIANLTTSWIAVGY